MDTTPIGQHAAQFMQRMATEYGSVEDAKVSIVGVFVEIDTPDYTAFRWSFTDRRPWVQRALIDQWADVMDQAQERHMAEDDD